MIKECIIKKLKFSAFCKISVYEKNILLLLEYANCIHIISIRNLIKNFTCSKYFFLVLYIISIIENGYIFLY